MIDKHKNIIYLYISFLIVRKQNKSLGDNDNETFFLEVFDEENRQCR
jgi:hypothetical protein